MDDKFSGNIKINLDPFHKTAQAMIEAGETLAFALRSVDAFNNILRKTEGFRLLRQPTFSVTSQLNLFGWQHVDVRDLTPDERWEYQCWIWSAPVRWIVSLWIRWQRYRHSYAYSDKIETGKWSVHTNYPFVILGCPNPDCNAAIGLDEHLDLIDKHGTLVLGASCRNCGWEGPVTLKDWNNPPDGERGL